MSKTKQTKKVPVLVRPSASIHKKLTQVAKAEKRSVGAQVLFYIEQALSDDASHMA